MALIPCKECGKTISSEAFACPHCGRQVEPKILAKSDKALAKMIRDENARRTAEAGGSCLMKSLGCVVKIVVVLILLMVVLAIVGPYLSTPKP